MEFSPFSPKIFLTYGSDWYVRIWIEGITQPIIELNSGFSPIRSAYWCPNNSSIIACTTRSTLNIWNIRKSILKPASSQTFESPLTICRYFLLEMMKTFFVNLLIRSTVLDSRNAADLWCTECQMAVLMFVPWKICHFHRTFNTIS